MWRIKLTHSWVNTAPQFVTSAVLPLLMRNLQRYVALLKASKSSKSVEAGYLHSGQSSIVSIDATGLGENPDDTRIYTFADDSRLALYLLGIAKAESRNADMEYYKNLAYTLINGLE